MKWTHEEVRYVAKKCRHRSEFQEKWSGAFKFANRNGLLDELFPEKFPDNPYVWNYEECKKISEKYNSLAELSSTYHGAYKSMLKHGWMDEFYPDRLKHSPYFDYSTLTYDECKKVATKFEHVSELLKKNRPVYNFIYKNGWVADFFSNYKKMNPTWTYDRCKETVSKYEYLNDFTKENSGAYTVITKNGWLELFDGLKRKTKPSGYWTYERCKEHALKFTEKQKISYSVLYFIYKNGWYELLDHTANLPSLKSRYIYVFEFEDGYAYVGLSYDPNKRKGEHLSMGSESQVRKHLNKTKSKYKFKILTEALTMIESSHEERRLINEYRENGWILLNKNNGGALGSKKSYTYEQCKKKVLGYKTLKEFRTSASGYYCRILKEKWGDLLEPLEKYNLRKSNQYYIKKYRREIRALKRGLLSKEIVKVYGIQANMVWKIKKILKEEGLL